MQIGLKEDNVLFSLEDVTVTPVTPRLEEPITISGKVKLFTLPFLAPIWVQARVTAPERWYEHYIPIWGSPTVAEGTIVVGGDFEIAFPRGFDREGEFVLEVNAYAGPTYSIDKMTLPPFPPVTSEKTTFIVAGEVPPEEVGFRAFRIISYSKNSGPPVTPPGVLELDIGDRCRVNVGFDHKNGAVTGEFHAAIWQKTLIDPHDEILHTDKAFTVPSSPDWKPFEGYIDIVITSAIAPGTEYGLHVKIMGITGGDIFTEYLANVITIIGPPELGFELTKPTVSETPVDPGTPIDISCPVTSRCTEPVDATAKVIIYEGSAMPEHGTKLKEYDSGVFRINPGETQNVIIRNHVTVAGTIDRRDVEVEVYVEGRKIKESEWDDVFYVKKPEEVLKFEVRPTASPTEVAPGEEVTITCRVTSRCTKAVDGFMRCHVREGSIYAPPGDILETYRSDPFTISPGQTKSFTFDRTAVKGTIDRRDIDIEVFVDTEKAKSEPKESWDDVYYVKEIAPPEMRTLEIDITPRGTGYVTTSPAPLDIENYWTDDSRGQFEYGTRVRVTAYPSSGYVFDHWSDEIQGGVSYSNPEWVSDNGYMYDNKAVKAHFKEEYVPPPPPPPEYTLTVTVSPSGAGSVTKSPDKAKYSEGERVGLTAYPYSGYEFDYWGGIVGTPSSNPVYIDMYENYRIMAVFKKIVIGRGMFLAVPTNEPIAYEEWCFGWQSNTVIEASRWVGSEVGIVLSDKLLVGKAYAWLWPGAGEKAKMYGPTRKYTLRDGGRYYFDIKNLIFTEF